MTSSDAGATSSSINSPIAPSPIPTLSNAPSLTLSPVSTTSDKLIHRPFAGGLLSPSAKLLYKPGCYKETLELASSWVTGLQVVDLGRASHRSDVGQVEQVLWLDVPP